MLGISLIAIIFQLAFIIGVVVFAVKFLNRVTEIAEAQKTVADSQVRIVEILTSKQLDDSTQQKN